MASKLLEEEHHGANFTMKSSCQNCAVSQGNEKIEVTINGIVNMKRLLN